MKIYNYKKQILVFAIVLICFLSFFPSIQFAATPSDYGLKACSDADITSWFNTGIDGLNIYFKDSDGTIYKGSYSQVFNYLKNSNSDIMNTYRGRLWGTVSAGADPFDQITFYFRLCVLNRGSMATISALMPPLLLLQQSEYEFVTTFYPILEPFVCVLYVMYLFTSIAKMVMENKATVQSLLRHVAICVFMLFLIAHAKELVSYVYAFSNTFANQMLETNQTQVVNQVAIFDYDDIVDAAMKSDFDNIQESFAATAQTSFIGMCSQIFGIALVAIAAVMMFSRKIAFNARMCFLPYAMITFPDGRSKSSAARYLKYMIGDALLSGIYVLLMLLTLSYQSGPADLGIGGVLSSLLMPFALITAMKVCEQVAKEIGMVL